MDINEKKIQALQRSNRESRKVTRESIRLALLMLMKDKDFDKISVSSIIEKAGVSRAGFYRNYSSREDVMHDISLGIREHLEESLKNEKYYNSPNLFYSDLFRTIKDNASEFRVILDANVPRKYIIQAIPSLPEPEKAPTAKDYYTFIALLTSLRTLLYEWFRNGMKETPEEMADIITEIFHK